MEKSIWQKYIGSTKFDSINGNSTTDILIIGAGISGITTAYNLRSSKYKIILIDRDKLFNGATSKSTAKITYLQELIYQKINGVYDYSYAKLYYESQKDAINIIIKNINENNIECDLKKVSTCTFTNDEKEFDKFDKEEEILNKLGIKYYIYDKCFKDKVKRLILVKNTYDFNPVKYLHGLLKEIRKNENIKICENSCATEIKKEKDYYVVKVNGCEIRTKKIVLTCHYPFFLVPGLIPFKTYLEKSYMTCSKVQKTEDICAITSNYPTISFRYYEDKKDKYFIYLNNSSKICDKLNYKKNYDECVNEIKKITNNFPDYKWTNMDVMTNDSLPIISRLSETEKNVFIATGFNTWGMTNGTIAGKVIADFIMGKKNKYKDIFSISRKFSITKLKNFISNTVFSNTKAYAFNLIKKNPSWYKNKALVTTLDNKRVGIYYDEEGNEHIVSNICPHLKCFLTFNEVDKTWDCPCHGSRFNIEGNAIKGPSQYSIKIEESNN